MTSTSILLRAADLCEKGWTQEAWARSADGRSVASDSTRAVCWCAEGAIKAAASNDYTIAQMFIAVVEEHLGLSRHGDMLVDWNDHPSRTQAEVVSALRSAAALAEKSS